MRRQPKRAGLIAERSKAALRKRRAVLLSTFPKVDGQLIRLKAKDGGDKNERRIKSRGSMLSSLTPSTTSTLDLQTLSSNSFEDEDDEIQRKEMPIIKNLYAVDDDIFLILPALNKEFLDVQRNAFGSGALASFRGTLTTFISSSYETPTERKLNSLLKAANDYLWCGNFSGAEAKYKVRNTMGEDYITITQMPRK